MRNYDEHIIINNDNDNNNSSPTRRDNMSNLFRAYSNDDVEHNRFTTDTSKQKFMVFSESCDQADLASVDKRREFSFMMIEKALQYYSDLLKKNNPDLGSLEKRVKTQF